jgi:hypothetical protein
MRVATHLPVGWPLNTPRFFSENDFAGAVG